ncbi:MAG: site-2 protease family protein [Dehalococcoidia bacterium]|nr:site-2 protease family protein [Dehalococcoidia bacterium]MDD5493584.1 site-2 protease family protein [Dehalococcoidia bacterium]
MKGSLRIARIAGIDVAVHYTWLFIFFLITWSLAAAYFPAEYPGWSTPVYWITSIVAALLLFVSVLLHELAHSLVAKSRGLPVKSITLFLLGGISNLESEPKEPGLEFIVAIAGPLSSLALAAIFWGVDSTGLTALSPVKATTDYLVTINVLLAAFNILPGFPLDGGRVLRSIIWGATGNLKQATNIASIVGQAFGWLMIALGVFWSLAGNLMNGIWLVLIGWFLNSAAESARRELELRSLWLNVRVASVMNDRPETIGSAAPVEKLVNEIYIKRGLRTAPVVDDGRLVGIVTLTDVRKIPQSAWDVTPVSQAMTRSPLYTVKPDDNMSLAVNLMAEHGVNQLPVVTEDRLVGLLCRADVIRYVQVHHELGRK